MHWQQLKMRFIFAPSIEGIFLAVKVRFTPNTAFFCVFFRVSSLKIKIATDRNFLFFRNCVTQCLLVNYKRFQIMLWGFRSFLQSESRNKHGKFIFSRFLSLLWSYVEKFGYGKFLIFVYISILFVWVITGYYFHVCPINENAYFQHLKCVIPPK